ncbi:MAG TPA: phytoene/squalene synthase family protein [Alphaproteobacteria bacterium]|nr:phytoene/squalene synthase family protein [Alphaproteobacteria bacterium]
MARESTKGADRAEASLSYCAREVRRHDPDRFLTALFAPPAAREGLFTLYAFNHEVAKTREVVTEALLGRIRLEWWRETVGAIYDGETPRVHEVVLPLADLIARRTLSRARFERLIEARERDLEDGPPATLAALEDYAAGSAGSLVELALEALGVRDAAALEAGRSVGTAWALTGLLRAVPFHARRRRLYLPQELLKASGADPEAIFERGRSPGLAETVEAVAGRARHHLAAARKRRGVPRAALPALLPARLADGYLAALGRVGFDPFALPPPEPRMGRPLSLVLAALRGAY